MGDGRPGSAFIQQGPVTLSPSSDAFSHTHPDPLRNSTPRAQSAKRQLPSNGTHPTPIPSNLNATPSHPRRPKNAFDLYCNETSPALAEQYKDEIVAGTYNVEAALAQGWSTLDPEKKAECSQRFEQTKRATELEKEGGGGLPRTAVFDAPADDGDEDVEMGDEAGTPATEAGGFTAVNQG